MEPVSSNRCIKGGIFNVAKSQYSPETREIVNGLIQESRLTLQLRQRVQAALDRGEPLPVADARARPLPASRPAQARGHAQTFAGLHMLPPRACRRPRQVIERSGAYERDAFLPRIPRVDRAKELARFQNIMTYGKSEPPMENIAKTMRKKKEDDFTDLLDEADMLDNLMEEIDERLKFLEEMKQLGEEKKYQQIIMSEITRKLQQIEKIDKEAQNLDAQKTVTTSPE